MGFIRHEALLFNLEDWDEKAAASIEVLRAQPKFNEIKNCLVGPVEVMNGTKAYCLLPDGSKEGWSTSDLGDDLREALLEILKTQLEYPEFAHVRFGGDEGGAEILEHAVFGDES